MKVGVHVEFNDKLAVADIDGILKTSGLTITALVLHSGVAYDTLRQWATANNVSVVDVTPEATPVGLVGQAKNIFDNTSETRSWLNIVCQSETFVTIGKGPSGHFSTHICKDFKVPVVQLVFKTASVVSGAGVYVPPAPVAK